MATQVRETRAGGVTAYGWLPKDHGPRALADYALEQGAHRVFVPELEAMDELREPGIAIERVRSRVPSH
jgi:hypothetical protein